MTPGTAWRPLLIGRAAERARSIAIQVAADMADRCPLPELARRDSHVSLLFAYLGRLTGDAGYGELAARLCDEASENLERFVQGRLGLHGGLAGLVWLDAHLERELGDASADDADEDGDPADVLARFVDLPPGSHPYGLIGGLAGFGVMWLERLANAGSRRALARLVEVADATAVETADGLTWPTPVEWIAVWERAEFPAGYHDLGIAQGVPGLLVVLARIGAAGIARETVERLVAGGVAGLLAQREPSSGWMFPSRKTNPPTSALPMVRWCYGGLGVGAALLASGRLLGLAAVEREGHAILRAAAAERDGRAVDSGLCHGFGGNGHIFNRAFQLTGDPALEEAARFWLGRAIDQHAPGNGIGGYQFWGLSPGSKYETTVPARPPRGGWQDDPSWLTGSAGTAMALLAAVDDHPPAWDVLLALSG